MTKLPLFPAYAKWIALALVIADVAVAIIFKDYLLDNYKYQSKEIGLTILSLALLIRFLSRRNREDEMLSQLRLVTMASGLFLAIIMIFINNLVNGFDALSITADSPSGLILNVMIWTTIMFELQNRRLKRELSEE